MALILEAPGPAWETKSYLPNPQQGDSVASAGTVEIKRAKDGTKYLYVKSRDQRKKLIWSLLLSQHKAYELQAFFDAYSSDQIRATTEQDGKVYIGNFITNPFEFEAVRRAVASPSNNSIHQIQIEFEGFEQTT